MVYLLSKKNFSLVLRWRGEKLDLLPYNVFTTQMRFFPRIVTSLEIFRPILTISLFLVAHFLLNALS